MSVVLLVGVPSSSIERTAPVMDRAVVDDGYTRRSNPLAHQSGERGCLLTVEVAFQTVADGFVEQDTRPTGTEDDGHFASRGRHRF